MFEPASDSTPYRRLELSDQVKEIDTGGQRLLVVPDAVLRDLASEAFRDVMHLLRPNHLEQLRNILDDPEAGKMDRYVA